MYVCLSHSTSILFVCFCFLTALPQLSTYQFLRNHHLQSVKIPTCCTLTPTLTKIYTDIVVCASPKLKLVFVFFYVFCFVLFLFFLFFFLVFCLFCFLFCFVFVFRLIMFADMFYVKYMSNLVYIFFQKPPYD